MALAKKAAIAAFTVAVGLGTIAAAPAASASVAAPTSVSASAVSYTAAQEKYVRYVRAEAPAFKYLSKRDTVDMGKMLCSGLKSGLSGEDVIGVMLDSGFNEKQTVAAISGAVLFLCPGQQYKFT